MVSKEIFCRFLNFSKKHWYIYVIIFLIFAFVFKDVNNNKLIKEYKKQIEESENTIKQHEKEIKMIDSKIDSIQNIINKLSQLDKENEEKIKEVDKKGKIKKDKIDKEDNPNILIEEYKKTIKKHEKD
jgi:peptidoglycan hydrolase CwlO-like protein